jgi:UDP-N-acetylmuramoylalanine--D-glutamate ligase
MGELKHKRVVVIGLGVSGRSAARFLQRRGAKVLAVDSSDNDALRREANPLVALGVEVRLGVAAAPAESFDLAVLSPGVAPELPLVRELAARGVPLIGELELGCQHSLCLNIAITGTNGKTTTTELVARMLEHCQRRTVAAGNIGLPVCDVVDQTKDLDYLTLEVSSFQLETIRFFRPVVAVLLNLAPDHLDRYASMADYIRAKARIFENQQPFDFAIIQSEALAQLRALKLPVPGKIITFSANNRRADLFHDRGLLVSRLEDWSGPLLNMDECRLRGPHNAENLMAALAVSRVLRLPLENVVAALKSYAPAPHRCELVAEVNGVKFINDSKATNLDALHKALLAIPAAPGNEPNVWLIAGGKDKGFEYHDIGPMLSQRVKGAYLLGETREKLRAAWSLFTPCSVVSTLLEAVTSAARNAVPGDVVLLSPACSSFDMFLNYQHRGEMFRDAVKGLANPADGSSGGGSTSDGGMTATGATGARAGEG